MSTFIGAFNKAIADEIQYKLSQPRPTLTPNPQQLAVFNWGTTSTGSANIVARAGTGKSTTILELARTVDRHVFASTFHSLGLRIWKMAGYKVEIDSYKTKNLARSVFPHDKKLAASLASAVSFAKQSAFGCRGAVGGTEEDWAKLIDYYQIDDEVVQITIDRFISECAKVYQKSLTMCTAKEPTIDFDDMLLAPLYFLASKPCQTQYDWVMVDECQDSNVVRRLLAKWIMKPNGRMVAVGDDRQAIYHFAGASSDAMNLIKEANNAIELPLNVTYRCPQKIVELAKTIVPDFTAHESAPEGVTREIDHSDFWLEDFATDGTDVILCRNTRPLVGVAMRLRERGISCLVEGQSGQAIINLISKWGEQSIGDLLIKLSIYEEEEVSKWRLKGRPDKAEMIEDRVGIIRSISEKESEDASIRRLIARVEMLFGDDNRQDVLRLCTIHRAKGREFDRVFILGRNCYMPSPWAETAEERKQEENLEYVAITRVKRELVDVKCSKKQKREEAEWWEL